MCSREIVAKYKEETKNDSYQLFIYLFNGDVVEPKSEIIKMHIKDVDNELVVLVLSETLFRSVFQNVV